MGRPKKLEGSSSAKSTIERVFHPSTVKNKLRRQEIFQKLKNQKSKERRDAREKRKKAREELGDQVAGSTASSQVCLTASASGSAQTGTKNNRKYACHRGDSGAAR